MTTIDSRILEFVKEYQKIPRDFSYDYWEWDMDFWGFTPFDINRDSGILDESNWDVISKDLMERFPDNFDIMHCSHWAVGWMDHLMIKLKNKEYEIIEEPINAVLEWVEKLENYPVASDDDHSAKQYTAICEALDDFVWWETQKYIESKPEAFKLICSEDGSLREEFEEHIKELVKEFIEVGDEVIFDRKRAFEKLDEEFGNEVDPWEDE